MLVHKQFVEKYLSEIFKIKTTEHFLFLFRHILWMAKHEVEADADPTTWKVVNPKDISYNCFSSTAISWLQESKTPKINIEQKATKVV